MTSQEQVVESRRTLGQQLASWRRHAGLTQEQLAARTGYSRSAIANVETGRENTPHSFWVRCDHLLDSGGALLAAYDHMAALTQEHQRQHKLARERRRAARIATSPVTTQIAGLGLPASGRELGSRSCDTTRHHSTASGRLGNLSVALTDYFRADPPAAGRDDKELAAEVAGAKRHYQSGRYQQVIGELPSLLGQLRTLVDGSAGAKRTRALTLAAGAHQVACSISIKFGDASLATLAADRSMNAAKESGDPIAMAASARAVTHATLAAGHYKRATDFALSAALKLRPASTDASPTTQAVYGSLLLRAAIAAARGDDRDIAHSLLAEARARSERIEDQNAYWTFFCPVNVTLHEVSVAVTLGDAGLAVDRARRVDPRLVPLAERRACFYIELARAFAQWGKYEQAYEALCAAESAAPQEISARPDVHGLLADIEQRCPRSVRPQMQQLAQRTGVAL